MNNTKNTQRVNHNKNDKADVNFEQLDLNTNRTNFTRKKSTDYNS